MQLANFLILVKSKIEIYKQGKVFFDFRTDIRFNKILLHESPHPNSRQDQGSLGFAAVYIYNKRS